MTTKSIDTGNIQSTPHMIEIQNEVNKSVTREESNNDLLFWAMPVRSWREKYGCYNTTLLMDDIEHYLKANHMKRIKKHLESRNG